MVLKQALWALLGCVTASLSYATTLNPQVAQTAWQTLGYIEKQNNIPSGLLHSMSLVETGQGMEGMVMPWPYTVGVNSPGKEVYTTKLAALTALQRWYRLGFRRFDITVPGKQVENATALTVRTLINQPYTGAISLHPKHFGQRFATQHAASRFVKKLLAQNYNNIDIGLMQINWRFHSDQFKSVDEAFDPAVNAGYAVAYLKKHRQTRDWWGSVGRYHSGTSKYAKRYIKNV